MTEAGAAAVLDWLVRRCSLGHELRTDLVLVRDHPVLAAAPGSVPLNGVTWPLAKVTGEITLRAALLDVERLVAVVPPSLQLPEDLAGRAFLGRALPVQPHDLVAGLAGRFCEPLDATLAEAVERQADALAELRDWSFAGRTLSAREVRAALLAATVGNIRLDKTPPAELLARWLREGVPQGEPYLVRHVLTTAHGVQGEWLAWLFGDGSLEGLVAAGAVRSAEDASRVAPGAPRLDQHVGLRRLVERAVRDASEAGLQVLVRASEPVERMGLGGDAPLETPLLAGALERALMLAARAADRGEPWDGDQLAGLRASVHAEAEAPSIALVEHLSRLARFCGLGAPDGDAMDWLRRTDAGWADLALRQVRRLLAEARPELKQPAGGVLDRVLATRDAWSGAFAAALARDWSSVAASRVTREPLPLHQVSRALLRRLTDAGRRVLLVVLDGCGLSTFYELQADLERLGLGVVVPGVSGSLGDDLRALAVHGVGVAPVPTVTSHARRALFAGDIPGDSALNDTEAHAANASGDRVAWGRNAALGDVSRGLFLKGDLGKEGGSVLQALRAADHDLLAVVFNGVDDSLSSKETTPAPRWTVARLGAGAVEVFRAAAEGGWDILLTADHGHTPHLSKERKLGRSAAATRFALEAGDGLQAFEAGPLPRTPLHLATRVGAWFGSQRRGYHGGAGLEEVQVPLVFLGRGGAPVEPPAWWSGSAEVVAGATPVGVSPQDDGLPPEVRACLSGRGLRLVQRVCAAGRLSTAELATELGIGAHVVEGEALTVLGQLSQAQVDHPFTLRDDELTWTVRTDWTEALPEGPVQDFFRHLERHGSISEPEAAQLFGSPRKLRRFKAELDRYETPFAVRLESTPAGDLFVKESR